MRGKKAKAIRRFLENGLGPGTKKPPTYMDGGQLYNPYKNLYRKLKRES